MGWAQAEGLYVWGSHLPGLCSAIPGLVWSSGRGVLCQGLGLCPGGRRECEGWLVSCRNGPWERDQWWGGGHPTAPEEEWCSHMSCWSLAIPLGLLHNRPAGRGARHQAHTNLHPPSLPPSSFSLNYSPHPLRCNLRLQSPITLYFGAEAAAGAEIPAP